MSSIGSHDGASLASLLAASSSPISTTSATPASREAIVPGTPANMPGALPAPRHDLPSAVRERTVESVHARSAEPPQATVPSRQARGMERLEQASGKLKEASDNGVDLAKSSFFKKLLGVATAIVAVGVATALTVVSGGVAAPLLAVSCANLAVNIGDSVCAYRNLRNAQDVEAGLKPRYLPLPGGNSCLQNLFYGLAKAGGASDDTAKTVATVLGGFFQLGLAVGAAVAGSAAGVMALAPKIATMVANGIKAAVAFDTAITSGGGAKSDLEEAARLVEQANRLPVSGAAIDQDNLPNLASTKVARVLVGDVPQAQERATAVVDQAVSQYGNSAIGGVLTLSSLVSIGMAAATLI